MTSKKVALGSKAPNFLAVANRFGFPFLMSVVVHVRPKKYLSGYLFHTSNEHWIISGHTGRAHDLHVKAWRKNGYPPVASQFDVPPVVARVLGSFHGHHLAPEEEGYYDH